MGRNKAKDRKKAAKAAAVEKGLEAANGVVANGSAQEHKALELATAKQAEAFKEKGNAAFSTGRFDQALDAYTQAVTHDPNNASLYSNRSATYAALRKYEAALKDAEKVLEMRPDWPKGYLRQGNAYEGMLMYPEAHDAYKKGLQLDPEEKTLRAAMEELTKLLDELKINQKQLASSANPETDKFEAMCHWLRQGGSKFPTLYMQYYTEDYRGVHALTKIPSNQVILYIPLSQIMTSEVAKESEIGRKIIESNVELRSKHSYLAAFLCQEKHKGRDSYWWPYINVLPEKYRNMPIFFNQDELKLLKGSFTLDKISDRVDSLRREYENIRRGVPEFGQYSHWEFVWARLVVITRIFGLVIKGKKTDGLVPYADMLNHKRPREDDAGDTRWTFDDDRMGFTITSLRTIPRGEQVFDSYGRKCNSRFFVNYGFTLDENDDNEVVIRVALPTNDPHYATKIQLLGGRETAANREFQVPANYKEKKTKELFSFLRFVHAQNEEMLTLPSDGLKAKKTEDDYEDRESIDEIEPMSIRNEIAVLKHLSLACKAVLDGFDTSLEEDLKILAQPRESVDSNVRNCVVMRAGEKRVLHWFIDLAKNATPLLQTPWKDLKRIAAKCSQGTTPFDYYVNAVVAPLVKKQN